MKMKIWRAFLLN